MRSAETILSIIRKRGQRRLPVKDAYRLLYQRDLYLRAYGKLYRNEGAMTRGATPMTGHCCRQDLCRDNSGALAKDVSPRLSSWPVGARAPTGLAGQRRAVAGEGVK